MFIGPWDQGGPWNPSGIEGMHRFLGRVWARRLPAAAGGIGSRRARRAAGRRREELDARHCGRRRARHHRTRSPRTTAQFHFNTAISKLMELTNALVRRARRGPGRDRCLRARRVDTLLLLLAPIAPHVAEELWARRGQAYTIHQQPWPVADPALAVADTIELPVQVDGKLRDRLVVTPDTPAEEIERLALACEHVQATWTGARRARSSRSPAGWSTW